MKPPRKSFNKGPYKPRRQFGASSGKPAARSYSNSSSRPYSNPSPRPYTNSKPPAKSFSKPQSKSYPTKKSYPSKSAPAAPLFPMRINKYLAHKGYSTRRGADEIIQKRWVTINGRVAVLGDKVTETDLVEVKNNKKPEDYTYYVYNKPKGMAVEKVPAPRELVPVLGLDTLSEGLVIFTSDKRIIDRLANLEHKHEKEYLVKTITPLRANFKEKMEQGVTLPNKAEPIFSKVTVKGDNSFLLRVTDHGTHIRQMCALFQTEIESLKRIRILNVTLGAVEPGEQRELEGEELAIFLKSLGL